LIPTRGEQPRDCRHFIGDYRQDGDQQIAAILNKQGRRTGTGLPFNQPRVAYLRVKHGIPAAPPPDPDSNLFTVDQAATELGVSEGTVYRWLRAGLLPGDRQRRTRRGGSG